VVNYKKFSLAELKKAEELKALQLRFRDMLDQLDKKEISDIFDYGLSLGLFAKIGRIHFGYEHGAYTYVVTRWRTPIDLSKIGMVS